MNTDPSIAGETTFRYVLRDRMRILVADDDPIQREFAKVYLSSPTADVELAADGSEALTLLRSGSFDIVLTDVDMPVVNGFELLESIRKDDALQEMPVIVITGRDDVESIDRAFDLGATSFVVKAVNWRLLSYQILFVLRAHRASLTR